jgi:hypothetical protein
LQNGQVLIAGGDGSNGSQLASAELYNPKTKTFSATGSMAHARDAATATLLNNGNVLVAGGVQGTGVNTAEIYNPSTGTFSEAGNMSQGRYAHAATLMPDGSVLITGGYGTSAGTFGALKAAEKFLPASGQFTPVGNLVTARAYHTATLLTNGTVLIAAGTSYSTPLSSAEIYTPSSLSFAATGGLKTARYLHTATALEDGTVLIVGGSTTGSSSPTASAEIYSPTAATFASTANMATARNNQTATLMSTGKVLIAGGGDVFYDTPAAELYSYPFASGNMIPKYVVLGVIYSPPGSKSFVNYSQTTAIGTSSSITDTFSNATTVSASLGISAPALTASLTQSEEWTQQADTIASYAVNKTTTNALQALGPLSSSIGVDHDYDLVLVWLNPMVNLSVGAIGTDLLWNGYQLNPNDVDYKNNPDVVAISIFCLKNPFLSPTCTDSRTYRSWDTSGLGGLTVADFTEIAARDPFYSHPSYDPNNDTSNRFTDTGQTVYFNPAPPGDGPIVSSGTFTIQTTATAGQDATDSYQVNFSLDAGIKSAITADLKYTDVTTWMNKWSATQTDMVGQTSQYSITSPVATDNYSGPTGFEVWQDNVYGTFMFVAPGTTPASPGTIGTSPASITFGNVAVGASSAPTQVTLTNSSSMPMFMGVSSVFPFTVASTALSPVAAFSDPAYSVVSGTDNCSGKIIAAAGTCTLSVKFAPLSSDVIGSGGDIFGTMYLTGETDAAVLGTATLVGTIPAATGATATPTVGQRCVGLGSFGAEGVSMGDLTSGAAIYYTTDGTTPTTSSTRYTGTLSRVAVPTTFKALAVASGYSSSAVATVAIPVCSSLHL